MYVFLIPKAQLDALVQGLRPLEENPMWNDVIIC
jgi:hypothetical protein